MDEEMSYIDKLIGYLNKLQLTTTQWAMLAMAAIISGLVTALKIEGSALHRAQVKLLEQNIKNIDASDANAVEIARNAFNKAYYSYTHSRKEE